LIQLREIIKRCAPDAQEVISYQMPAYKLNGILLYFAAHKNHIGFYPGVSTIEAFKEELSNYKLSKGTVQFQHKDPFPTELIEKLIRFRVK